MPAKEVNKVIYLEHPSGSKAEVSLFGNKTRLYKKSLFYFILFCNASFLLKKKRFNRHQLGSSW